VSDEAISGNLTLSDVKLGNVGLKQISGEQFLQGEIVGSSLNSVLKYGFDDRNLIFIFSLSLSVHGEETEIAKLAASAAVSFSCPRPVSEADQSLVEEVAVPAMMVAYPFLREAISDMARKINLPRISLGLLRAGNNRPETITLGDKIYDLDVEGDAGADSPSRKTPKN